MGIQEKIKEVEAEMARTQKNKATEYHLGQLKAKLAKLRTQLQTENAGPKGGPSDGFDVGRYGDGKDGETGPDPSIGRSPFPPSSVSIDRLQQLSDALTHIPFLSLISQVELL